jgi:hypothetical protein
MGERKFHEHIGKSRSFQRILLSALYACVNYSHLLAFFKMVPVKRPVAKISVRQREAFAGAISELGKYWNFVVWHA